MPSKGGTARIPLRLSQGCVVASIQTDLEESVLRRLREDLLGMLASSKASGVILDLSGVEVMDGREFDELRRTMAMAAIMGARTVITGLRPGVVSSLVDLGADIDGVVAALNIDDGFELLSGFREPRELGELGELDEPQREPRELRTDSARPAPGSSPDAEVAD